MRSNMLAMAQDTRADEHDRAMEALIEERRQKAILEIARMEREAQRQAERLRVVHVTMRTVHDIVNNCLNQLQILRLDTEGYVPEESLALFDQAIRSAAAQLKALGDMDEFTEKRMEIGMGLDCP